MFRSFVGLSKGCARDDGVGDDGVGDDGDDGYDRYDGAVMTVRL